MNSKLALLSIILIVLLGAALIINSQSDNQESTDASPTENPTPQEQITATSAKERDEKNSNNTTTIQQHWQWNEPVTTEASDGDTVEESVAEALFTPQSVHDALYAVKLDENGNLILDNDALVSLDEALESIYHKLDQESLLELTQLIESALPGPTGVETAQLVRDYHGFLVAQDSFNQMHSSAPGAQGIQSTASIEYDQNLYKQLKGLRSLHLGEETSYKLFHTSDVNSEFMFESIKLSLDDSLTQSERTAQMELLETRRLQRLEADL